MLDVLRARSAAEAHAELARLGPRVHSPFHLLYADRTSAHLTYSDDEHTHQVDLGPGLHVITERSPGAAATARSKRIRAAWSRATADRPTEPPIEALRALLAEHDPEQPLDGACVHHDALGYGTRSSMILVLRAGTTGRSVELHWAEGKPCRTPWTDLSELALGLS